MKKLKLIIVDAIPLLITVLFCSIFLTFFQFAVVEGDSMLPSYQDNDIVLVKHTDIINRGDIVTVKCKALNETLIKRVIAVEGDLVELSEKSFVINGGNLIEPYVFEDDWLSIVQDCTVPSGSIYIAGDNRNHSTDSRVFGCLSKDDVIGVVIFNVSESLHLTWSTLIIVLVILWGILILSSIFSRYKEYQD